MNRITSVNNKIICEVSKFKNAKHRKQSKMFCAEGIKLIIEAIQCNITPVYCFVLEDTDITTIKKQIPENIIYVVSNQVMKKISSMATPPDIILVAKERTVNEVSLNSDMIIALDCIQDPSNMGAIIRSAEAFGVKDIIIGNGCCDVYSPKTLRGAMGSIFRLNLHSENLTEYLPSLKKRGYTIIGAGLDRNYKTVDKMNEYSKKVIVIGNEGNGISNDVMNACDFGIFIPMTGKNESLNAAVAASIFMWENQRQKNG